MQGLVFILFALYFAVVLSSGTTVTGTSCGIEELPCDLEGCVRREGWCDGNITCDDGSDEAFCKFKGIFSFFSDGDPNRCEYSHFLCNNGQCVPKIAECDGYPNCKDGSDETECKSVEGKSSDEETGRKEKKESEEIFESEEKKNSEGEESKDSKEEFKNAGRLHSEIVTNYETETVHGTELPKATTNYLDNNDYDPSPISIELSSISSTYSSSFNIDTTSSVTTPKLLPATEKPFKGILWSSTTEMDFYAKKMALANDNIHKQSSSAPTQKIYLSQTLRPDRVSSTLSTRTERAYVQPRSKPEKSFAQPPSKPERVYTGPSIRQGRPYIQPSNRGYVQPTSIPGSVYPQYFRTNSNSQNGVYGPHYDTRRGNEHPNHIRPTHPSRGSDISRQPPPNLTIRLPANTDDIRKTYRGYYESAANNENIYRRDPAYRNSVGNRRLDPEYPGDGVHVPALYRGQRKVPSTFHFSKNNTGIYAESNNPYMRRAEEFILALRDTSGGWGRDTPRALIALSLVNNSFVVGSHENDLMQKYFQVHLGTNILRNDPLTFNLNRLSMSVNALLATCQDPRDFNGRDLTELMRSALVKMHRQPRRPFINPYVYLSLCLADRELSRIELHNLMGLLSADSERDEARRDILSLAITAFACVLRPETATKVSSDQRYLENLLHNATHRLLGRMQEDGSFGSVYSTALAAQALMSVNDSRGWDPELTFSFLRKHQQEDGSFGDFLSTYYALPPLSGRSLLHVRNTQCHSPKNRELTASEILEYAGSKFHAHYSLYFGNPPENVLTIKALVPHGISFFDIMRVAQHQNNNFRFSFYEEKNGDLYVYSLSGIPNDSEKNLAWHLYIKKNADVTQNALNYQELYRGDVRQLFPTADQHLIFWYHPYSHQTG